MFERLSPWSGRLVYDAATAAGQVDHFLGGLATAIGRYDQANAFFAQSSAVHRQSGRQVLRRPDRPLVRENGWPNARPPADIEKPRDLLTKAHIAAVTHGYGTVERRAANALRKLKGS
jgi:hypothetical protein